MLRRTSFKGSAVFLLLALVFATVASVPTSVLVQNSEIASNSKSNGKKLNNNNINFGNFKVKRSSNNLKDSAAALNKKSSPEMVPESFNSPPQAASSASSSTSSARQFSVGSSSLPTNGDIISSAIAAGLTAAVIEAAAAAGQRELEQQQQSQQYVADDYGSNDGIHTPNLLRKRGLSSRQYQYGAGSPSGLSGGGDSYRYNYGSPDYYYNNPSGAAAGDAALREDGVWTEDIDAPYTEGQELENYVPRASYRNKAYDNLQDILNSETYLGPVAVPLQYPGYYGAEADRNKRSDLDKLNKLVEMRLKRDTKLTPADMLALVALVEAGERARKDSDADATYITYPEPYSYSNNDNNFNPKNSYYPAAYGYQLNNNQDDVGEYNGGAWLDPAIVNYYGVPYNLETLPKYELPPRDSKYEGYSTKRFMVAKKRSMGHFPNEPVAKPSFSYNIGKGEKFF